MSRGTNSWAPIGFVIYGQEPLAPARIEQFIVNALPSQELNIDSFEEYDEALDYCKKNTNIGVIFIHENCGKNNVANVFAQLAKPYKASGWPVVGVIIRKDHDVESIAAVKAMRDCTDIVAYHSELDFEDVSTVLKIFDQLWTAYIHKIEDELIPIALQESLSAVIITQKVAEEKVFYDRISEVLAQPLNLSWRDRFRLRWHYLVHESQKINSAFLLPHAALRKLILNDSALDVLTQNTLLEIASSKELLVTRAIAVCEKLLNAARSGSLDALLKEARTEARPGRPGILRHLATQSNAIQSIYEDTYQNIVERKVAS